jgi:pyridinium-3,5-biscarboxylic acid mononucleotide synthase
VDPKRLRALLEAVRDGAVGPDAALDRLRSLPFEDLGDAALDHHRALRAGVPEVILGQWKSAAQIARLLVALGAGGSGALATRVSADKAAQVLEAVPRARYHELARVIELPAQELASAPADGPGHTDSGGPGQAGGDGAPAPGAGTGAPAAAADPVAVVCAGTSDLPVAEEAAVTLGFLGHPVERVCDVGVAGLHRLFPHLARLRRVAAVIVVAGMEGALPSVVAGLVDRPVIAVPTSVGYGVSEGGFAALVGMLSSCSAGVVVVNIDNGFGAAVAAARMCRRAS